MKTRKIKRKEPEGMRPKILFLLFKFSAMLGQLDLKTGIKLKKRMTQQIRKNSNSRNCCLSTNKPINRQSAKYPREASNLHVRRGKANQNIINHQDKAIIRTRNVLEDLGRTQEIDQIPGTGLCRGPNLGLGPSLGLQYTNP
ncbi:MAG: hypothetical protein EZS28_009022 [Streblomastix strix]|uniref:Uncharacterized protein n=1 Tax=Streblomastix strix TaxID=222440 RepID=A0A5J4WKR8_9EUKA|nr:MAG: hypothetical protein EZS28_009022 [Streblomastix strix]